VTLRKMLVQFSELVILLFLLLHWTVKSAPPLLRRSSPLSLLYE